MWQTTAYLDKTIGCGKQLPISNIIYRSLYAWRACRRKNLSSASTSQILADSFLDFMNDSVNMLPNDKVTEDTLNFMSNLSIDAVAIFGREIYHN